MKRAFLNFLRTSVLGKVISPLMGLPGAAVLKTPPANMGDRVWTLESGRSTGEGPHVSLLKEIHGQRSLTGNSSSVCKESDPTEHAP